MYQAGYIERFGTGTLEIIRLSEEANLDEPDFNIDEGFKVVLWRPSVVDGQVPGKYRASTDQVTDRVTDQVTDQVTNHLPGKYRGSTGVVTDHVDELVRRLLLVLSKPKSRPELMSALDLRHNPNFRDNYLRPAMDKGFVEMTDPDSPNSPKQRYRLTAKGRAYKKTLRKK